MATKPAGLPRWADNGGEVTEPSEAKKNVGFIAERPAFGVFNWLHNLVYRWVSYFNDAVVEPDNGVVSGAAKTSGFPQYLSAGVTTRRFSILGGTTALKLKIDGTEVSLGANLTLGSDLALAASSNNTGTVSNLSEYDGSASTCYRGEYGGRIDLLSQPGSAVEAEEGKVQAFKIINGGNSEICLARYTTDTVADPGYHLTPLIRGIGGTDRQPLSSTTTIAVLKAHWIFINSDVTTIKTTPNYPTQAKTAPGSPATDDFWYNASTKSWARWNGSAWVYEGYMLLGIAICDANYCIAVEPEHFVGTKWDATLDFKALKNDAYESKNYLRMLGPGRISVAGKMIHLGEDTVIDASSAESGNGGSPWYYVYLKPDGTFVCSPKGPRKKDWRGGWYHPTEYWRCVGLYNRNIYGENFTDYDPSTGLLGMECRNDITNGEPGLRGYNFLTGRSIDEHSDANTNWPNIPPIVEEFNARVKAYATGGTLPTDIYVRAAGSSLTYDMVQPLITVTEANKWAVSSPTIRVEDCVVNRLAYFNGINTDAPTLTTFKIHFANGRIKL